MTKYCINCRNNKHPIKCAHCEDYDNYRQSKDSKAFEKEVRADERKKILSELKNGTNGNILIDDTMR